MGFPRPKISSRHSYPEYRTAPAPTPKPSTKIPLVSLPTEILHQIFHDLYSEADRQCLRHTCRFFYNLFPEPIPDLFFVARLSRIPERRIRHVNGTQWRKKSNQRVFQERLLKDRLPPEGTSICEVCLRIANPVKAGVALFSYCERCGIIKGHPSFDPVLCQTEPIPKFETIMRISMKNDFLFQNTTNVQYM